VYRALERELPSVVVILRRLGAAHQPDAADGGRAGVDGDVRA
jgi:hypothetical protein